MSNNNTPPCDCFMCRGFLLDPETENVSIELDKADDDSRPLWTTHKCTPKKYVGFTDTFYYCSGCNKQLDYKEEDNEKEYEWPFE